MKKITRRTCLGTLAGAITLGARVFSAEEVVPLSGKTSFLFKVRGKAGFLGAGDKLGFMHTDGSGLRVLDFGRPNHIGWGPYAFFKDGRRVLLMSIERNDDWNTKSFQEYYHKSQTHIWEYDIESGSLTERVQEERIAPFYAPSALLPGEDRILVTIEQGGCGQLFSMDLDGRNARRITGPKEYVYGVSVSPDGNRIAFHADYQIGVTGIDGGGRVALTNQPGLLHFGTSWSPDGEWVLYQVCDSAAEPGHDWSDIWIARPDGSEKRALTEGKSAWFASSYGAKDNPGNGSIMPCWAPDGSGILYARRLPDAKTPWEFQAQRPDTTHFNRDFKPELARGGTDISCIDPKTGESRPLTKVEAGQWDYRPEWSKDSRQFLFCRAKNGGNPAIWIADRNGEGARFLTDGVEGQGVEFPRFLRA